MPVEKVVCYVSAPIRGIPNIYFSHLNNMKIAQLVWGLFWSNHIFMVWPLLWLSTCWLCTVLHVLHVLTLHFAPIDGYNWSENGEISKMRNTLFVHLWWAPNICSIRSTIYLIMFLTVISKVFQHNSNPLVQLSIFLIHFSVGTYRLSSHARLEAFSSELN